MTTNRIGDLWLRRELRKYFGKFQADVSDLNILRWMECEIAQGAHKLFSDERGFLQFAQQGVMLGGGSVSILTYTGSTSGSLVATSGSSLEFGSGGSWTVTVSGSVILSADAVGGGGGGGGHSYQNVSSNGGGISGSGGGGGAVSRGTTVTLLPGISYSFVVGSGGAGGYGATGAAGGATYIYNGSSYSILCYGGQPGGAPGYNQYYQAQPGGAGGTVYTGSGAVTGGNGGEGRWEGQGYYENAPNGNTNGAGGGGGGSNGSDPYPYDPAGAGGSPGGTSSAGGSPGYNSNWQVDSAGNGYTSSGIGGGIGSCPTASGGGGGGGGGALIGSTGYYGGGGGGGGSTFCSPSSGGAGGPGRLRIVVS